MAGFIDRVADRARQATRAGALKLAFGPEIQLLLNKVGAPAHAQTQQVPPLVPSGTPEPAATATAPPAPRPASTLNPSASAAGFVKDYEKFRPQIYTSDGANKRTIGYGHLVAPDERFAYGITEPEASRLFEDELDKHANIVRRAITAPLTQQQFDALTALAYNAPSAFAPTSSVVKALNARDYGKAADAILLYDHAGKKVLPGLSKRRAQERAMFLNGRYDSDH